MYNLKGQTAIITGGGRGIGRAISLRLAREGANIVVADILFDNAKKTENLLREQGFNALALKVDVTSKLQVKEMIDKSISRFDHIHILINNAGVGKCCHLEDLPEEEWDQTIAVNLKGSFLCSQAISPIMIKQKYGKIVNFSSIAGKIVPPHLTAYGVAKGGIIGLTQSFARALGSSGINVNAVCPGLVLTDMYSTTVAWLSKNIQPYKDCPDISVEQVYEHQMKRMCIKEKTTPEDIASVVAFLVSGESRMISGQAINVCGGIEFH